LQTFKLNALETMYLTTSLFILLAGMAFQSGVATPGTGPHTALTYFVMIVLVGSVSEVHNAPESPCRCPDFGACFKLLDDCMQSRSYVT
jgi:hypothetical protein